MTDGEKMIWAATFALAYEKATNSNPSITTRAKNYKREIPVGIELACDAVEAARESLKEILEGFGGDSNVYRMLAIMVKRKENPLDYSLVRGKKKI